MSLTNLPKLQSLQKDPAELEKCVKDPLYFYNMYIRKEGEKVLDWEGYKKMVKEKLELRNAIQELHNRAAKFPITDKDANTKS